MTLWCYIRRFAFGYPNVYLYGVPKKGERLFP